VLLEDQQLRAIINWKIGHMLPRGAA